MKRSALIFLLFCVSLHACATKPTGRGQLFVLVSEKLEKDERSFLVYNTLYNAYVLDQEHKDKSLDCFLNLSVDLYNVGIPLVRLIKRESLVLSFERLNKTKKSLTLNDIQQEYKKTVRDISHYNEEENEIIFNERDHFEIFIEHYYLIPKTDLESVHNLKK